VTAGRTVIRVLAYHAIADRPPGHHQRRYGVPRHTFLQQIDEIASAGYHFIDADRFLAHLDRGVALPRHPVLVTFDDCHETILDAAEILERRGIPAVAFAIGISLGASALPVDGVGTVLNRAGLDRLRRYGVEIGAHSCTHPVLTALPDAQLWDETGGVLARFEEAGMPRPRLYAYPYGSHDARVRDCVRRAGAAAAFTVRPGVVRRSADAFALPRIELFRGDTGLALRSKLDTGGGIARMRAALRLRTRVRRLMSAH
jgi:peptidoglycan/xylan/chitin deacetylase (PgdA/CDA1 family)